VGGTASVQMQSGYDILFRYLTGTEDNHAMHVQNNHLGVMFNAQTQQPAWHIAAKTTGTWRLPPVDSVSTEMKTSLNIVLTDKFCVESKNNGARCGKHTAVLSCNDRMTAYCHAV